MPSRSRSLLVAGLGALAPLAGIAYLGWDWREIIVFYWLGNITIGIQVVLSAFRRESAAKLFDMSPQQIDEITRVTPLNTGSLKAVMVGFFVVHYGFFTLIHGVFVNLIATGDAFGLAQASVAPLDYGQVTMLWLIASVLQLGSWLIMSGASVATSSAYQRILVLHLSIILGGLLIVWLQWPAAAAVLLVAISVCVEVAAAWSGGSRRRMRSILCRQLSSFILLAF